MHNLFHSIHRHVDFIKMDEYLKHKPQPQNQRSTIRLQSLLESYFMQLDGYLLSVVLSLELF